jgi:hypothetical protein
LFREQLTRAGVVERRLARFDAVLRDAGYLAMGGQIVDATIVQGRWPRLSNDEKTTIGDRGVPAEWSKAKRAQMDTDGRWTIKGGRQRPLPEGEPQARAAAAIAVPVFGYKNHLGTDRRHGFIRSFVVTDAAAHDGTTARPAARPPEHRERRLGRQHLSLGGQRGAARAARAGAAVSAAEAARPADAAAPGPRQRQPGARSGRGRARVRRPEGAGSVW